MDYGEPRSVRLSPRTLTLASSALWQMINQMQVERQAAYRMALQYPEQAGELTERGDRLAKIVGEFADAATDIHQAHMLAVEGYWWQRIRKRIQDLSILRAV